MLSHMKILSILYLGATLVAAARDPNDEIVDHRIVGGTTIYVRNRNFQVAVLPQTFICGGSLIKPNRILTAAHCTHRFQNLEIRVRAGSNFYFTGGAVRGVTKVIQHIDFNPTTLQFDIALLYLVESFPIGLKISVIPLAKEVPPTGTEVIVSGFGTLESEGKLPTTLQSVIVKMVDWEKCNEQYEYGLNEGMICACDNGKDSCQGDSGGPITHGDTLLGVVSFGNGCADAEYPGIYTSVPYFTNWINANVDEISLPTTSTIETITNTIANSTDF